MDADLDALVTALYVKIDDMLAAERRPGHPGEAEPGRAGVPGGGAGAGAALPLVKQVIRDLAVDGDFWFDDVRIADSTPVECGRSRPTVRRSEMAGWANYGYCASHSRWFWGLRLYLICTPAGMPVPWALADPKIGEREVLGAMLGIEPGLAAAGITLLRPARKDEPTRPGEPLLKTIRQLIESVNDTLKGQLDLEARGGRTFDGVAISPWLPAREVGCRIHPRFRGWIPGSTWPGRASAGVDARIHPVTAPRTLPHTPELTTTPDTLHHRSLQQRPGETQDNLKDPAEKMI